MEDTLFDLFWECNEQGISIFQGHPVGNHHTDFAFDDVDTMLRFCQRNAISNLFLYAEFPRPEETDASELKETLRKYYDQSVQSRIRGFWARPHITEEFYQPVWAQIERELEQAHSSVGIKKPSGELPNEDESDEEDAAIDLDALRTAQAALGQSMTEESDEEEEEVLNDYSQIDDFLGAKTIWAWVFHQGASFRATVFHDDISEQWKKQGELLQTYQRRISELMHDRFQEADRESRRIEKEKQDVVYAMIEQQLSEDPVVATFSTKKDRCAYADRIANHWQTKPGYEWITKKAVQAIVDKIYYRITE